MKNTPITIIAGPCSVDDNNIHEIHQISEIEAKGRRAIAGTRVVGLKSRTELDPSGDGMGMDFEAYKKNSNILMQGGGFNDFITAPSVYIAQELSQKTGLLIATEVMNPLVQLPSFEGKLGKGAFLPWNPSVNQLGWHVSQTADFARRNGWHVGIKNGKWLGDHLEAANAEEYQGKTTMEKTWAGLVAFVGDINHDIILIHRGVDVPGKGSFRNIVVHSIAKRVKEASGAKLYFDPSHSYGPKLQSHIVDATVEAMKMKLNKNEYLYDGILVEVGTSITDTEQHISIKELEHMVKIVSAFRSLKEPGA
jgi:3-deoxy-D-arabino-heptulosonate 7-phosphate (DAHP) synthase